MLVLALTPKHIVSDRIIHVGLVHDDSPYIWYCRDLETYAQRAFRCEDWIVLESSETAEGEIMAANTTASCAAKNCIRHATVLVKHYIEYCTWQLAVCEHHKKAAEDKLWTHKTQCPETHRECVACHAPVGYDVLYQRVPQMSDYPPGWIHVHCLTDSGDSVKVGVTSPKKTLRSEKKGMKDPVTKREITEEDLPDDLDEGEEDDELEPAADENAAVVLDEDDDDAEFEDLDEPEPPTKQKPVAKGSAKPKAEAKPAPKPTPKPKAEAKPAAKTAAKKEAAKPAAKTAAKPAPATLKKDAKVEKALKGAKDAVAKKELPSRATGEKQPDGDTTIMYLIRGKGGRIDIRLNSGVVTQFQNMTKDKSVLSILARARYWVSIKSEEEADKLIEAATKISTHKNTKVHLAKAMDRFVANIERWRKDIRKFA